MAGSSGFYPPRLATPESVARTNWLESFFDLVFAAAITALGVLLGGHLGWEGLMAFVVLSHAVFWLWANHTVYSSRFDSNDVPHRLLTFALMLAAAAMAVQIPRVLETGGAGFVAAYLGGRFCLIWMHARPARYIPEARGVHGVYYVGSGVACAIWLASLALPPPWRFAVWALATAVDLVFPWFDRGSLRRLPVNPSHFPDRLGIFVTMVLGEALLDVVSGLAHLSFGPLAIFAAGLAFTVAVCIWWSYFAFVELAEYECTLGTGIPYLFAHLPLVMATIAIAVGLGRFIDETFWHVVPSGTLTLLGGGLLVWLGAFLAIQGLAERERLPGLLVGFFVGAGLLMGLALASGPVLSPLGKLGAVAAVFVALVIAQVRYCETEIALILAHHRQGRELPRIGVDELVALQARGVPVAIVDVRRHPSDRQIPGSYRLDPDAVLGETSVRLPFDRAMTIATYCT